MTVVCSHPLHSTIPPPQPLSISDGVCWCWARCISQDLEAELTAVQRQLREQRNVVDEKEEELYELNEKLEAMVVALLLIPLQALYLTRVSCCPLFVCAAEICL